MNIIIFNSHLLPYSQTFIRDPVEKLQRFRAYYVGSHRVSGLALPDDRTLVVNDNGAVGKLKEQLFKLSGIAPSTYRKVQQLNPVLIHAQFGLSGALMLPWADRLNVPLIVHYRGADATANTCSSLNHWVYLRRKVQLQHKTSLFLTVSKFIKDRLLSQGFPKDKIAHHYHGVDIQQFSPDLAIPREPVVLFVGRLIEKKGVEYLIHAIAQVQRQRPDVSLVVIGDGPLKAKLETLSAQHLKQYNFLGRQPPETVKQWMNRASLLAAPSVTAANGDSEGLPNVVLEAQAMALPVISTRHAGIPEAVLHAQTGFLTAERDVDSLAYYSLQVLNQADLRKRLSHQGRAYVENYFDRERQTQQLETHYDHVLENWSSPKLCIF